jgi:hypothetical protein
MYFTALEDQAFFYGLAMYGAGCWAVILNDPVCKNCFLPGRNSQSLSDKFKSLYRKRPTFLNFLGLPEFKLRHTYVQTHLKKGVYNFTPEQYFDFYKTVGMPPSLVLHRATHKWKTVFCDPLLCDDPQMVKIDT